MDGELIFEGAEARLTHATYLGVPSVRKERRPKPYRHPELDRAIRSARQRDEALILSEASRAGVRVPRVLDVDSTNGILEVEFLPGPSLREQLEKAPNEGPRLVEAFGRLIGRLHEAGLVHGDPTTSNAIVTPDGLALVDFGLAQRSAEVEDRGVDIVLVERTLEATHPGRHEWTERFHAGYAAAYDHAEAVTERAHEIRARGRYV